MPNISVHFPSDLLNELDELADGQGVSRNELIVEGCRQLLEQSRGWPEAILELSPYGREEMELLRSGRDEFERSIKSACRSKSEPPF